MRTVPFASFTGNLIAFRTCEISVDLELQAAPVDTAIPCRSSTCSRPSPGMPACSPQNGRTGGSRLIHRDPFPARDAVKSYRCRIRAGENCCSRRIRSVAGAQLLLPRLTDLTDGQRGRNGTLLKKRKVQLPETAIPCFPCHEVRIRAIVRPVRPVRQSRRTLTSY